MDTWRNVSHVSKLKKKRKGKDKMKKRKVKRKGWTENRESEQREREKGKKKVFYFSLRSTEIRLTIFVKARGKVHLGNGSYMWALKLGSSSNSKR